MRTYKIALSATILLILCSFQSYDASKITVTDAERAENKALFDSIGIDDGFFYQFFLQPKLRSRFGNDNPYFDVEKHIAGSKRTPTAEEVQKQEAAVIEICKRDGDENVADDIKRSNDRRRVVQIVTDRLLSNDRKEHVKQIHIC